ncbi:MAG: crossover junction endodeoxyribonuclease RuvC, partial [Planctomycetia bacterium]
MSTAPVGESVVVGFDPGLNVTGYGVIAVGPAGSVSRPRLLEGGVLRIPAKRPLAERLADLHKQAAELLDQYQPSAVAVEELFSHYDRPRTAILMGHARGVLLLAAGDRGVPVSSYLPTMVKKQLTGSGRAAKPQMQLAVRLEFGLTQPLDPPDVADALAVALCHYHASRRLDAFADKPAA